MARSNKTFAHALTLSTGPRVLSTNKPDHSLKLEITEKGKVFTLTTGDQVNTVKSEDYGGAASVRSIADQLVERLAQTAKCSPQEMSISEADPRPVVKLNLEAVSVKKSK